MHEINAFKTIILQCMRGSIIYPFFFLDLPRFEFSNQLGYIQFNIWLADDCFVISTSKINSTRKNVYT